MKETLTKIKNSGAVTAIKSVLSSKFFPFISAAVTLLCYYLGWDIVLVYYISITGIFILLLLDDVTPIISVFLFMSVMISYKNSPSAIMGNSDYYFRTENLVQIITLLVLFISAAVFRIIKTIVKKKFTFTPIFFGLCAFAVALLLNGIFSKDYIVKNLLYGLIMAASFLCIYSALKDNLNLKDGGYEKIAFAFLALSLLLLIELIVAYVTTEGLFTEDIIDRYKLKFGWGVYNTFGVFMVMCIPAVIYLATKMKYGFVLNAYAAFLFIATFFSCSRQSMIGVAIIYPVCIILLLVKGKNKIPNMCIIAAVAIALIVLLGLYQDKVIQLFKVIFGNIFVDGELSGSGRTTLWREAIENFKASLFLGAGFYVEFSYSPNSGLGFIPYMCHNTILQIMSSCGIIGLLVYAVHRIQTVICYFKNITLERTFIALSILAMLIISLFDNHIFNIFPTIIYSSLIAVLVSDDKKMKKPAENKI